jgi:hypothetical protein
MKRAAPPRRCEKRELVFFDRSVIDAVSGPTSLPNDKLIPKLFLMTRMARFLDFSNSPFVCD